MPRVQKGMYKAVKLSKTAGAFYVTPNTIGSFHMSSLASIMTWLGTVLRVDTAIRCFVDDDGYQVVAYRYYRDDVWSQWQNLARKRPREKVALFLPKFVCDKKFYS